MPTLKFKERPHRPYTRSAHKANIEAGPVSAAVLSTVFSVLSPPRRAPKLRRVRHARHSEQREIMAAWGEKQLGAFTDNFGNWHPAVPDFPLDNNPDIIGIGEPAYPVEGTSTTSHVEREEGGYTMTYCRETEIADWADRQDELEEKRTERARRARRVGARKQKRGAGRARGKDGKFVKKEKKEKKEKEEEG